MTWYSSNALGKTWDQIKNSRGRDGRRSPSVGLDGVTAEKFNTNLDQNIAEIHRLLSQPDREDPSFPAYRFAPFRTKTISSEPGKLRQIHIPRIRDQIVLRAVSDEISRVLSKKYPDFLKTSPRHAVKQVIMGRESGKLQVLRADINKYYPSIPHPFILKLLADLEVDPKVIRLTQRALTVPLRDTRLGKSADQENTLGTPTGTSLSTVLGECYLLDLENSLQLKNIKLIRYVDDILILAEKTDQLELAHRNLAQALEVRGLALSKAKTWKKSFKEGFDFLGFSFDKDRVRVMESKALKWGRTYQGIARRFAKKIKQASGSKEKDCLLEEMAREVNRAVSGASGMQVPYYSIADDLSSFKELDKQIRVILGGIFRRSERKMCGSVRLESAHTWAWKYKNSYENALQEAREKFASFSIDSRNI
jgi:RNA-directed DNA polymerase